jgi:hypothetical protein
MGLFARAVITGFGFTLGALLLRKVAKQLGIEDPMYPSMPANAPVPPVPPASSPPATSP